MLFDYIFQKRSTVNITYRLPTNKKNNNKRNSIIFLGCIIQVCIHNITQKIQQQKLEQTKKTIEREVNIYIYFISENVFYMRNNKTVK